MINSFFFKNNNWHHTHTIFTRLNKEKLDYNLQVLIERNKEHSAIQSSYKNRLNRLRETMNTLLTKYNKLDSKYNYAITRYCHTIFRSLHVHSTYAGLVEK